MPLRSHHAFVFLFFLLVVLQIRIHNLLARVFSAQGNDAEAAVEADLAQKCTGDSAVRPGKQ